MVKATISSKGQIAIPKVIRERLNLKSGTQVILDVRGEHVVMKRIVPAFADWKSMRGMAGVGPSLTVALEREHREELAREKNASIVLDSWAVLAWIKNEPAAGRIQEFLEQADAGTPANFHIFMSWINVGEVYYMLVRKRGVRVAEEFLTRLPSLPVRVVLPDEEAVMAAARLKSKRRLSYADAFAAALAQRENAALVTGDPELRDLRDVATVEWIGPKN